jgi:membrane protein
LHEQVESSKEILPLLGYIGGFLSFLVSLIPLILLWLVFILLYLVMPNIRVVPKAAIFGGIIAGLMFQLFQWGYIYFQSTLSGYGAIYGSFAALPLFLMWLQLSWLIVLFGAELSFAYQNIKHYEEESETEEISQHFKRIISLMIVKRIAMNFKEGIKPLTTEEIANELDIPVRLVRDIIYELLEVGIVSETVSKHMKENAFQPAQDLNRLKVAYIIDLLDKRGTSSFDIKNKTELNKITRIVDGFDIELSKSKLNSKIYEIE